MLLPAPCPALLSTAKGVGSLNRAIAALGPDAVSRKRIVLPLLPQAGEGGGRQRREGQGLNHHRPSQIHNSRIILDIMSAKKSLFAMDTLPTLTPTLSRRREREPDQKAAEQAIRE